MGINLAKRGSKIDLTKGNAGLKRVRIGLGWDVNRYSGGYDFDLDVSVFLLRGNGKCLDAGDFIFYNNLTGEGIEHLGDNLTGGGDGDDEVIVVDLAGINPDVQRITVGIAIYEAMKRNQNFGQVSNAFVRVLNEDTGEELIKYDLEEDFSIETALIPCELYRHNGEWKFNAIGQGYSGGFQEMLNTYGLG